MFIDSFFLTINQSSGFESPVGHHNKRLRSDARPFIMGFVFVIRKHIDPNVKMARIQPN